MGKSRSFSIFLLKEGFDASNALREDHPLIAGSEATALPAGATLFVLDAVPKQPWWKTYFGVTTDLLQVAKGALVFLPAGDRMFVLAFGHVAHNLKEESYEYDFGLRVTLNCVDPLKLKNTDVLEPGTARRQRTQVAVDSDLTFFDFDRDTKILKSLTGKAKAEYRQLINHATGASNLRINTPVVVHQLVALCTQLLALYRDDAYLTTFPDIHNITPVSDPAIIEHLNARLLDAFRTKSTDLYLAIPAIVDYQDGLYIMFTGVGQSLIYSDVFLDRYYEYLDSKGRDLPNMDLDDLAKHTLRVTDENGDTRSSYSIFKSLVFDTSLAATGDTYHLAEGNWYRVAGTYVGRLRDFLDPLCITITLPSYNHQNEGAYNIAVAAADPAYVCLDKTDISLSGQTQVEPCDLYAVRDNAGVLHHVKVSTFSADLSHLFNQGTNALQLLILEKEARDKLTALLRARAGDAGEAFVDPVAKKRFEVVFAIVTHKDRAQKSNNLPLFSRISLMRILKTLQLMSVPASFGFVADERPKTGGKQKPRKKKPHIVIEV